MNSIQIAMIRLCTRAYEYNCSPITVISSTIRLTTAMK